jgi:3' terminal RNA ribose 2'-O-methyltransferase Hen1
MAGRYRIVLLPTLLFLDDRAADDHDDALAGDRSRASAPQAPRARPGVLTPFGQAHVFYPEVSDARCTAGLLLDVDPVGLIRRGVRFPRLDQYVNDRPYVASSFLSVAIARVFGTALAGRCSARPDLPDEPLPLQARIPALLCRGGEDVLRRLFEPLGYTVHATRHALDERFPEWGESPYFTVELDGALRLRELLAHLYVLVPVMDVEKHYWVGEAEVEKLLRRGGDWLPSHPDREQVRQVSALVARRGAGEAARRRGARSRRRPAAA